jgi:glutamate dehydrogenase/leucine dehydrogenase
VPDFVANSGGAIASWVDFLAGTFPQALSALDRLIGTLTREIITESRARGQSPRQVAVRRVHDRIHAQRGKPRPSFEESKQDIRQLLGL